MIIIIRTLPKEKKEKKKKGQKEKKERPKMGQHMEYAGKVTHRE